MIQVIVKIKVPWKGMDENQTKELSSNTSIAQILKEYEITEEAEGNFLTVINGKIENKDYILQEGDELSILPALIGG